MATLTRTNTSTPTISIVSPTSSSRPSLDLTNTASSRPSLESTDGRGGTSIARRPPRNRSALREFYGLKKAAAAGARRGSGGAGGEGEEQDEIDRDGFDADGYVKGLLEKEGLKGLLKVENGLINDIKGFDGERKSLVYDNYNKLITATDTIRNMRANMDPLTPTTSTLPPAISHIATISASIHSASDAQRKKDTVRWVVNTPDRMRRLIAQGRREDALAEWAVAMKLMAKWTNVGNDDLDRIKKRADEVLKERE